MPWRPAGPCTKPGCPELATNNSRCDEHQRQQPWSKRPSFRQRYGMSTSQWEKLRQQVLKRDQHTCQTCGARAGQVDHIISVAEGGARTDPTNLAAICNDCHRSKSRRELAAGSRRREGRRDHEK